MIRSSFLKLGRRGSVLFGLVLAACADPTGSTVPDLEPTFSVDAAPITAAAMACTAPEARSASAVIGRRGGSVALGGHSVEIPPGALTRRTRITITRPASNYMELDLRANDYESFEFRKPVTVTIHYGECGTVTGAAHDAWYVDSETKAFLEKMGGTDDPSAGSVTFATDHFSFFMVSSS